MGDFILKRMINDNKDNIRSVSIPYNFLFQGQDQSTDRNMVVFLGDNLEALPGTDVIEAHRIANLCLDYVRRECKGYDLYYKPHPKTVERDEGEYLNLSGFKIEKSSIAELYFLKNIKKIKYVFSTCSLASETAYQMGLNSYTFTQIIAPALDVKALQGRMETWKHMPLEFYIHSLNQPLRENRNMRKGDNRLEENLKKVLARQAGVAWIVFGGPASLVNVILVSMLIKKIDPLRKVSIVVTQHHRWKSIPVEDFDYYFDGYYTVPRVFYSLRPKKIMTAIKTALHIKKFPISKDDIIIELPGLGFTDDCFASYFKKNTKIAVIEQETFPISCEEKRFSKEFFRVRPGALFFNHVLEPILGLERTLWLEDKRRLYNVNRYRRPMNDIFDLILIMESR